MIVLAVLLLGYVGARRAHWPPWLALGWAAISLVAMAALAGHGTLVDLSSFAQAVLR